MRAPADPIEKDFVHVFVRDRGQMSLSEYRAKITIQGHPNLRGKLQVKEIPSAEQLSWRIPLLVSSERDQLDVIASSGETP